MNADDEVQAQIQALKDKFVAGLPDRLAKLSQAFDDWQASEVSEKLDDFHRLAHSLTGAGATFGCAKVSQAARELESYLKDLALDNGARQAGDVSHISQLLAALRSTAQGVVTSEVGEPASVSDRCVYLLDVDGVSRHRLTLDLRRAGYAAESFAKADDLLEAVVAVRPCVIIVHASLLVGNVDTLQMVVDLQTCQAVPIPLVLLGAGVMIDEVRLNVVAQLPTPVSLEALILIVDSTSSALGSARQLA